MFAPLPRLLAALAMLCALAFAAPATAQNESPEQLYSQGVQLFKEKRFEEAAQKFQLAYNLDPSPILLYNLARASEELGDGEMAISHYRAYLRTYPEAEDRADVERRIRVLEAVIRSKPKEGRIVVEGFPPDARILLNGAPAPPAEPQGGWTLVEGQHEIVVEVAGFPPWKQVVELKPETVETVRYSGAAGATATAEVPAGEDEGVSGMRIGSYVAFGVGAAAAGAAIFLLVQASGIVDDGNSGDSDDRLQAKDDLDSLQTPYIASWAVAGAAIATGAVLLYLDMSAEPAAEGSVSFTPTLGPGAGGLGLSGTF